MSRTWFEGLALKLGIAKEELEKMTDEWQARGESGDADFDSMEKETGRALAEVVAALEMLESAGVKVR